MSNELSDKHQNFVREYLIDLNATKAALRAGYSQKTAYSQGQRLLKNAEIKTAIDSAIVKRSEENNITASMVLKELARIAFSDLTQTLESNSNGEGFSVVNLKELPENVRRCIKTIEQKPITTKEDGYIGNAVTKISFYDKMKALDLIGRHLGMWSDMKDAGTNIDALQSLVEAIRG